MNSTIWLMKTGNRILSIRTIQTKSILLALIWLLLFSFMITSTVSAHSSLVRSEPENGEVLEESPAQVAVWFSEELDSQSSTILVFDSQYNQVDNGDGNVDLSDLDHLSMTVGLPPLSSGTYTVQWAAVSVEDGDATEGGFTFTVGNPTIQDKSPAKNASAWFVSRAAALLVFSVLACLGLTRRRQA